MVYGATSIKSQGTPKRIVGSFMKNIYLTKIMTTEEHKMDGREDKHKFLILKKLTKRIQQIILKVEDSIKRKFNNLEISSYH